MALANEVESLALRFANPEFSHQQDSPNTQSSSLHKHPGNEHLVSDAKRGMKLKRRVVRRSKAPGDGDIREERKEVVTLR